MIDEFEQDEQEKRARQPLETVRPATVAAVVCPYTAGPRGRGSDRSSQAKLEEAIGLARAIDLDVRLGQVAPLRQITPAEARAVQPLKVEIVTIRNGDTPESMAAKFPFADFRLERFLALNGLQPGEMPPPGVQLKMVTR